MKGMSRSATQGRSVRLTVRIDMSASVVED